MFPEIMPFRPLHLKSYKMWKTRNRHTHLKSSLFIQLLLVKERIANDRKSLKSPTRLFILFIYFFKFSQSIF